jgi:AraC-like DNA-binding protein
MKRLLVEIRANANLATLGVILAALTAGPPAAASDSISIDDARFASQIGTPAAASGADRTSAPLPPWSGDFRGTSGQTCAGLDLNTFLHHFDPHELLAELRQSLLSGAQLQITNYLVALAYSAPTLASVLDMADRQLATRFNAFAQTCNSQQTRAVGLHDAERRMANASDQCFAREIARGTAPTGAYRRCSIARSFDELEVPAALSTIDFLRRHSDIAITPRIESLLSLLPDERIAGGSYQMRPPKMSLGTLSDALQARSRLALNQMIDGAGPAVIAECVLDSILDPSGPACLPRSASTVVGSPAFRGARLLGPAARSIFKDALSGQIAVTAIYSDLLDLTQQVARMSLRGTSDASAGEVLSRQRVLQEQVARVLLQADLQMKLQESKLKSARTQLLALERAQSDLRAAGEALQVEERPPVFSIKDALRLFQDRN